MNTEEKIENPDFNKEIDGEEKSETAAENTETSNELDQQTFEDPQEKLEKTISELNDKILRLLAENQNLRKNHEKEKEDILKYGSFNFASGILSLTDNLDRAFSIFKNNEKFKDKEFVDIKNGIELIEKELLSHLRKKQYYLCRLFK